MIESMDFDNPIKHLQNQLPYFEDYNYTPVELISWLLEMYLPGTEFEIHATETVIHINVSDQLIAIPFNAELHSSYNIYSVIEKINALFQQHEVEERVYGIYFNANPVFYYFICTPSEATSIFNLFEQTKEVRLADPLTYWKIAFVLPQPENHREVFVYNVSSLPFTEKERDFLMTAGFSLEFLLVIADLNRRYHTTLKVLRKYNDVNEQLDEYANGIIFNGDMFGSGAQAVFAPYAKDYFLFGAEMHHKYDRDTEDEEPVSFIMKLNDQFEVLHYRGTHGMNYNVTTEKIVEKLKTWNRKYGLTIKGVDHDWVDFTLNTVPEDLDDFANELYAFCPDCIDQGVGSMDRLKSIIRNEKYICLWWD